MSRRQTRGQRDRAAQRSNERRAGKRRQMILIAGGMAVVAVVALILAGNVLRGDSGRGEQRMAPIDGFTLGEADAPVTLDVWEDFQCPICKSFNGSALLQIEEEYVNTGKVKLVFHQFPFLGDESYAAAEASQCAADQDKFWEYHDVLFKAQAAENSGVYSSSNLKRMAEALGLDTAEFNTCLDDHGHEDSVSDDKQAGADLGVDATPAVFVNGEKVDDWRQLDDFRAQIDDALAAGSIAE